MNKIFIMGNLGADPETKTLDSGKKVGKLSVAVADFKKDAPPQWFTVITWEKVAETCEKYLQKGAKVLVEGRMTSRKYEVEGVPKYAWEIQASNVTFLSKPEGKPDDKPAASSMDDIPF